MTMNQKTTTRANPKEEPQHESHQLERRNQGQSQSRNGEGLLIKKKIALITLIRMLCSNLNKESKNHQKLIKADKVVVLVEMKI